MPSNTLAIALCRVSTPEQTLNNSLSRQEASVIDEAKSLGVEIVKWWSGDISSKAGTNVKRKDLAEMQEFCKRHRRIKYLIVDEPDRFMRSIDEAFYFEVLFRELGVKVWYACDPLLNTGDLSSKMFKFSKYLPAEGSNDERQRKSIAGQNTALKEGRYPFPPKPGYKRGYERAIHDVDEVRGPILRSILIRVAESLVTPSQGLVELNNSDFMIGHSPYKMDKFRNILTDPYYAGIVEINKQVSVRNENGLHEPLISKEQHAKLVRLMNGKQKNQSGPRKNGNEKYPLNNIVSCDNCKVSSIGRIVGFDHTNGKKNSRTYEKYRCRSCNRYYHRQDLHSQVEKLFENNSLSENSVSELSKALDVVWKRNAENEAQEKIRTIHKIRTLRIDIAQQVEAVTDPSNASIKEEILSSIQTKKDNISELKDRLTQIAEGVDADKNKFLDFAFKFVEEMGSQFFEISHENRLRCKQLVFPGGFQIDKFGKVYTPEISPLYRLMTKKKDTEVSIDSRMVRVRGL